MSVEQWQLGSSEQLARILSLAAAEEEVWQPGELASILDERLHAPIEFHLGGLPQGVSRKLRSYCSDEGLVLKSFYDLLFHPRPPIELLKLAKQYAKDCLVHPDSPLPGDVARVLYYSSIAVAMLRCRVQITSLGDEELAESLRWCQHQSWVNERLRDLLDQVLRIMTLQDESP